MKGKKIVKLDNVVPENLRKGIAAQEITSNFVLEIYEKAKRARNKKRKENLISVAEELSKHVGKWLVE